MSKPSGLQDVLPLTPLQEGLLFHALADPTGPDVYTGRLTIELAGPVDAAGLRAAGQALLDRHANLRLAFRRRKNGQWAALVPRRLDLPWREHDLTAEPGPEAAAARLLAADQAARFDPASPPLLRMTLVRLGKESYRLALTHHHLLVDGWSMPLLLAELLALYAGDPLPPAPDHRRYLDWLAAQDTDAAMAAWRAALADVDGPTLLAGRPAGPPRVPDRVIEELPAELTSRLVKLARRRGLTLNTVVQGAWGVLLGAMTGRSDVLFGATVAGRPPEVPGSDTMIGLYINTIPVRVRIAPGEPVAAVLTRLQEEQSRLMDHQHVGLAEVQRLAGIGGDLFDTLTVFENYPLGDAVTEPIRGVRVAGADVRDAAHYPLALTARPGEAIRLDLEYRPDVFDRVAATTLIDRLTRVLEAVADDPDQPVGRIGVLAPRERRQVVTGWNDTGLAVPDATVPGLFEEQVARTPDAVALWTAGREWSFAEVDGWANRFARWLADRGAGPGQVVALALPRALMVPGLLGVLKAGAAYLPLDADQPAERRAWLLADAEPALVVDEVPDLSPYADADLARSLHPLDAAYVIYTSGSTGRPKGVVVPHRALVNLLAAHRQGIMAGLEPLRVAHLASFVFDGSWDPMLWMFAGHTLHILDDYRDDGAVVEHITAHGIDVLDVTPTYLGQLVEAGVLDAGLRVLCVGGEAIDPALWRRVCAVPRLVCHDLYGPTETTVDAYAWRGAADGARLPARLANMRTYVLDAALRPAPPGVAGELYVGGAGLARGYLNRPDLTAERFVVDPFRSGERMYRTGDLARWTLDGVLELGGRADGQVKVRGFRIELGEIESVLSVHEAVTQAAVVVRDGRLVAYVVAADGDLRAHACEALPDYMVPAAFVRVEGLPRTVSGKLDVAALPEPDLSGGGRGPRSPREEILCGLFAEVLGLPSVGVDDDFFALGGHSLLVMRLAGRVRAVLDADLPIRAVFDTPTVAGLAKRLSVGDADRPVLAAGRRPERVPLSFAQQRLWFLYRLEGPSSTYNIPIAWRMHGGLDSAHVRTALEDVAARHEALRTVFAEHEGVAYQRILPPGPVPMQVERVAAGDLAGRMAEAAEYGFRLDAEPPLRAVLYELAPDEHVLLVLLHHIAGDEWSDVPLRHDFAAAYEARRGGRAPDFAPLPVQYADFAVWQRELLGDRDDPESLLSRQLAYWRDALADLPEELALPTDRPRPVAASHRGDVVAFDVPAELHTGLRSLVRESGTSMFMAVHAAVAVLLTRLGAGTDIPLGSPVAGRSDAALDDLVGFFVDTLVLRTDTSGDPAFRELLGRVRDVDLAAFDHQEMPFEHLVEALNPVRSLSRHPLFQIMVSYLTETAGAYEHVGQDVAMFDLSFDFFEEHDGRYLRGLVEYSTDLFDRNTVETFVDRLLRVLEAAVARPDDPIGTIDLLSPGERDRMLVGWNDTARPAPAATVADLFEARVARTPDAVALWTAEREWTFAELNRWANRFARWLAGRGVRPGQVVALAMPRALMVPGLLGVLKAGAAYLPIDADQPAGRIDHLLADARPALVVDELPVLFSYGDSDVARSLDPLDAAYVIYTSGSTGRPKGVVVPHQGLVNLFATHRERLMAERPMRVAHVASFVFDGSWEPLIWMFAGHALHVVDEYRDDVAVVEHIKAHRIDVLDVTPTYLRQLVDSGLLDAGLRVLLVGGEAIDPALWRRVCAVPGLECHDLYGPTEASVDAYGWHGVARSPYRLGNVRTYVLDEHLQPVPPGVLGELYVAGSGLARGYLNRPDLTAERFVADPFRSGERMYRTGDLARWTFDGVLEFRGRADGQVKVRGFRVELGEIESVLSVHEAVTQAAVVVRDGRLVAYVVAADADLRAHVAATLPDYMVPAAFVRVEGLPRTVNGKLDVAALPEPDLGGGGRGPRSPREEILCGLFAEVLGLPSVGVDDDFFALGGHSLLVMRLAGRVRAVLDADLPIRAVFDAPTVAGLSERLDRARAHRPALVAGRRPERVPLSFAQQRLWFLYRLEGPSPTYNIPIAWRMHGELDFEALRAALHDVAGRHEALRTVFPDDDGVPYQHVLPQPDVTADFQAIAPGELPRRLAEAARYGFELDREAPIRLHAFSLAPDEHVLLILLHHIAGDEWSDVPLRADLETACRARRDGQAPDFAPLPVQYADFAVWQRELLGDRDDPGSLLSRQLAYWKETLAGLPEELVLPTDRPRPEEASHQGGLVEFELSPGLRTRLRALARETGTSMFMVVQAAVATLLTRLGAGTDIPLGSPVAGRPEAALDDLVGFFVDTLVLRTDTSGDPAFRELLGRVRDVDLAAFDHQEVPFEHLVEASNPVRSLSRHPLFQTMVSYLSGVSGADEPVGHTVAMFDLSFDFVEDGGSIEYSADLFDRSTVERMAERLLRVLEAVAAEPGVPLSRIELLTPEEREQILFRWNDTALPVPELSVPELFEAQAARTPTATALWAAGREWTFAEVNSWANRLARMLIGRGIGPGQVVALALPRAQMVPGLLGVLKTGAAYLPIDPTQPEDRVAAMLADARPALVVHHLPDCASYDGADVRDGERTRPLHPQDAAYVIYTSGSTGRPKGVVVPHQGLANLFATHRERLMPDQPMRVAHAASFVFDGSWEPLLWLLAGHALHVLDDYRDDIAVVEHIKAHRIDVLDVTPTYLRQLVDSGLLEAGLKVLLVGGEAIDPALWRRVCAVPGLACHDLYGPTEASVDAYGWHGVARSPYRLGNVRTYVLDEHLQPVPPRVLGELYVGGAGLARGYLNRPDLTAGRFVADPFHSGERMYRTGDLARWTSDGVLELGGRTDGQVKVRGFRIELGEIESVLAAHEAVTQAAVVVRAGRLIAYVVAADADLRAHASEALPDYMVPAAFVRVEALPRTVNGKLDVAALPAPDFAGLAGAQAPRGAREELLCGLFAAVLGLPSAGADDDFFVLGGDSIVSIQLVSRARAAGLLISPREVFRHKTPAGLAAAARTGRDAVTEAPEEAYGTAPLTPIMRWLDALPGPIDGYSQSMLVHAPPGLDASGLEQVVQALLDRHDLLRATLRDGALEIGPPGARRAADCITRVPAGCAAPPARLAPREGAMLQVVWLDPGQVLLVIHHLAIDGVSWRILLPDLAAAWADVTAGRPPLLPPVGTSFRRWARGLVDAARQPERVAQTGHWAGILDGARPGLGDRPLDPARDTVATTRELTVTLPAEQTEPLLTTVPAAFHGHVNDVLLTALALALQQWSGRPGWLVTLEGHGREEHLVPGAELSRTVGWFTSEYPVSLHLGTIDAAQALDGGPAAGDAIKRIKEQLRAVPDNGLGYGLLRHLNPETAKILDALPEPAIGFNYLGRFTLDDAAPEPWTPVADVDSWGGGADDAMPVTNVLEVNAVTEDHPDGPRLSATWSWPGDLLDEAAVRALAQTWFAALAALAAHARNPAAGGYTPSDLALVSLSQDDIDDLEAEFADLDAEWETQ